MRLARSRTLAIQVSLMLLVAAAPAHAQEVGSTAVLFEPSIEAAGMGGGGVAYFWRDEPNSWSNPALLGTQPGFRYSYGTTQILEEFADDVYLKSSRFSLGYGGVGVLFAGQPFGSVGQDMKLDYGESQATDIDGNVIATFSAYEEVRSIGVGVSLLDLLGTVLGSDSGIHDVRQRLGISVGHTWKDIVFETDPEVPSFLTPGEAEQKDRGAAIRITPLDEIRDALDEPSDRMRWKIDLAGGYAQLNYDEEGDFFFDDTSIPPDEVYELRRAGGAARMTLAFPSSLQSGIHDFITPTVRLGLNFEKSDYYDDGESFDLNIERVGAELVLADAFYLRWGHIKDDIFEVDDTSWGAGLALRYKGLAGVRFDYAHYPYSPFLEDEFVDRYGVTVLVDLAGVLLDKPTFGEKF